VVVNIRAWDDIIR